MILVRAALKQRVDGALQLDHLPIQGATGYELLGCSLAIASHAALAAVLHAVALFLRHATYSTPCRATRPSAKTAPTAFLLATRTPRGVAR